MSKQDYYDMLGVSRTASADELKRAFRIKAKECHPDYHPDDKTAESRFKELNEAYEVLKDPQKRAAYDQYGHDAFKQGGGAGGFGGFGQGFGGFSGFGGFENIFEEMFSGATRSSRGTAQPQKGEDVRYDLELTLEEAYQGLKKTITVDNFVKCDTCSGKGGKSVQTCPSCGGTGRMRQRQGFFVFETDCPACRGTGKSVKDACGNCKGTGRIRKKRTLEVNVPKGVDTGIRMRLSGEGNAGFQGTPHGDMYVFIAIKDHDVFVREGNDLYCEMPIDIATLALGGELKVPTIDGKGAMAQIKAGTQTGTRIRLKGKGMPVLRGSGFGDLYVDLRVVTPTNLSDRQKELLREFSGLEKNKGDDGFLSKIKRFLGDD